MGMSIKIKIFEVIEQNKEPFEVSAQTRFTPGGRTDVER
jgi:hypothetical protein